MAELSNIIDKEKLDHVILAGCKGAAEVYGSKTKCTYPTCEQELGCNAPACVRAAIVEWVK